MLRQVADGVLVHESEFLQSHAVVVHGTDGALLVDPGITGAELACIADDLSGHGVVAGFATHPHWDHVLWDARLGTAPRYATARAAAAIRAELADPDAKANITDHLAGTEVAGQVPLELYGLVEGLPAGTEQIPWEGPRVRILEHAAHAPGHAALWIEDCGVLVAGDMLSDALTPFLDLEGGADPVEDYLEGLRLLEEVARDAEVVVPGHGSVGDREQLRARIDLDRAYVLALRDGREPGDPRLDPSAIHGAWLPDVHAWQVQAIGARRERAGG